jgi:hypothetical protein
MKRILILAPLLLFVSMAFAKKSEVKKSGFKKTPGAASAKLGTNFRFDGASLQGKFQNSPSTTAIVENDKFLEDLLGARKGFQDRIAKDSERD